MLTDALKEMARQELPRCKSLTALEAALGGGRVKGRRDWYAAARTWALYDGFHNRPASVASLPPATHGEYSAAYHAGRALALELTPAGATTG